MVGLRSKMYATKVQGKEPTKKAKGIKTLVVKKTITFDDYLNCLKQNDIIIREQCTIRSRMHVLYSERHVKVALSPHDDKRYLLPNSIKTLPWGHYSL